MFIAVILVFLSYSSSDLDTARDISSRLQAAGCEVWDYQERTKPGDDWWTDVEMAMDRADVILLLISPASKASEYTRDEWAFARVLKTENPAKRIVAMPLKTRAALPVARFVWLTDVKKVGQLCTEEKK